MKLVKLIACFQVFIFLSSPISAQNYWDWAQSAGIADEAFDFITTKDRGSIACGTINLGIEVNSYVIKFDSLGNILWELSLDRDNGGLFETAIKVVETDFHYFVAVTGVGSNLFADIVKIDYLGEEVLVDRRIGYDISDLHVTDSGSLLAYYSDINADRRYVTKYDSSLEMVWETEVPNTNFVNFDSHSFINSEGNFQIFDRPANMNLGYTEVDADGNIVQEFRSAANITDIANTVMAREISSNRYALLGTLAISASNSGLHIMDEELNRIQTYPLADVFNRVYAMNVIGDNIYVAGNAVEDIGIGRIQIYKADLGLDKQVDLSFINEAEPNTSQVILSSLNTSANGDIAITGFYQINFATAGRFYVIYNRDGGFEDISMVADSDLDQDISLYPNPTPSELFITGNESYAEGSYMIYNSIGVIVAKGELSLSALDVSALAKGKYLIAIRNGANWAQRSFIKE